MFSFVLESVCKIIPYDKVYFTFVLIEALYKMSCVEFVLKL